jgi:hypothetical protein
MSYPSRDWLKAGAAQDLAQQITDYWAAQGKTVTTKIEGYGPINERGTHSVFVVRSNMINGMPQSNK